MSSVVEITWNCVARFSHHFEQSTVNMWTRKDSIRHESKRLASFAVATRTANAMDVSLDVIWKIVINDNVNVIDIYHRV